MTNLNVPPPPGSLTFVAGDFDGNGRASVALTVSQPQVGTTAIAVMLGNGDGPFQRARNYDSGVLDFSLATGDFNSDGKLDIVAARNDALDSVAVLFGSGGGTRHR